MGGMKVLIVILVLVGLAVAVVTRPQAETPTYSAEFKRQAGETIDAIGRLERFTGAIPEFEVDRAIDALSRVAKTPADRNAISVILNYRHRLRMAQVTSSEKDLAALNKTRVDISAIEAGLR